MPATKENPLALLFARHGSGQPCRCHQSGYCPAHGAYNPVTDDPEIQEAVIENSSGGRAAARVIRKVPQE